MEIGNTAQQSVLGAGKAPSQPINLAAVEGIMEQCGERLYQLASRAESIVDNIGGPVPREADASEKSPVPPGQIARLNMAARNHAGLIDRLDRALNEIQSALS